MEGNKIKYSDGNMVVPNDPIIPFIEGDGIGVDIWPASKLVLDSAVEKAYSDEKKIIWKEVLAGEKAYNQTGEWLPQETLDVFNEYLVGIKGPLTTPVGGGITSLNVALRQKLDLFACVRPVRWFNGTPSPVKNPSTTDMVIFRENTEDIYAGIEFENGSDENKKIKEILRENFADRFNKIRFPETVGLGIKPISVEGTYRLVRSAIQYAIKQNRSSVTLVHKGNIMKYTEGAFRDWGYKIAKEEFGAVDYEGGPWQVIKNGSHEIIIKDVIADAFLQQILLRPKEYSVIATMNLNGDYISDALAACVGGIGIAPGANIGDDAALFEATHGTAPKYAGQDKVNPGSLILSAEMMLRHLGWVEAADLIIESMEKAIEAKMVTYDFERLMENANLVSCSGFAEEMIKRM